MQTTGSASPELTPALAAGVRTKKLDAEWTSHADYLRQSAEQAWPPSDACCSLLPHRSAAPQLDAVYKGRVYRFCCTSCREVFFSQPELFVKADAAH